MMPNEGKNLKDIARPLGGTVRLGGGMTSIAAEEILGSQTAWSSRIDHVIFDQVLQCSL